VFYQTSAYTNDNLYNRYYSEYIEEITDKDSKIVTGYLWINPSEISLFSFRKKYFINNSYFIFNRIINYNPMDIGSVQVELIKLIQTFQPVT